MRRVRPPVPRGGAPPPRPGGVLVVVDDMLLPCRNARAGATDASWRASAGAGGWAMCPNGRVRRPSRSRRVSPSRPIDDLTPLLRWTVGATSPCMRWRPGRPDRLTLPLFGKHDRR